MTLTATGLKNSRTINDAFDNLNNETTIWFGYNDSLMKNPTFKSKFDRYDILERPVFFMEVHGIREKIDILYWNIAT